MTGADGTTPVASVVTHYTYDPLFSKITSTTDPNGHTTFFLYDSPLPLSGSTHAADAVVPTLPGGAVVPQASGRTGNLLATVDALGDTTTYTYAAPLLDGAANFTYADISTFNGTYGPGDRKTETDATGHLTRYESYDRYGNSTAVFVQAQGNDGSFVTQQYDARSRMVLTSTFGRTSGVETAHSHTVYAYDALDRTIQQTQFDDLDPQNDKFHLAQNDPSSAAWAEETLYSHYAGGQIRQTISGLGTATTYLYDTANRLRFMTELFSADGTPTGPKTSQTSIYGYDEDNNLVDTTDFRGIHEHLTYDKLNRLIETDLVSGPAGSPGALALTTTHYDAVGNKIDETDLHQNKTTYDYDGLYRQVAAHLPVEASPGVGAVLRTAYDPAGNVVLQTDANGNPTRFSYDLLNRMEKMTDALGDVIQYSYDPIGNLKDEKHRRRPELTSV